MNQELELKFSQLEKKDCDLIREWQLLFFEFVAEFFADQKEQIEKISISLSPSWYTDEVYEPRCSVVVERLDSEYADYDEHASEFLADKFSLGKLMTIFSDGYDGSVDGYGGPRGEDVEITWDLKGSPEVTSKKWNGM